ncbi:MAG: hypothetical protein KGL39_00345 [Patescibacteria group bacterium]|nr:hypothetical protein [Patescibacteria group bacterium]
METKLCSLAVVVLLGGMGRAAEPVGYYPEEKQRQIRAMWPKGIDIPHGLRFYKPTNWSQRVVINNGLDHHHWVHVDYDDYFANDRPKWNPNRLFPWRVPGGLDLRTNSPYVWPKTDWESYIGCNVDVSQVQAWVERVEAGASRLLPIHRWRFPRHTVFVDLLVNNKLGKPFELRLRSNHSGVEKWESTRVWSDKAAYPRHYTGHAASGKTCNQCHSKPGSQEGYGIRLRGSDGCFSWPYYELMEKGK